MPNQISAAVGTQRQFSKQPEGTYERRLNPLSVAAGGGAADQNAMLLAQSLGVLGSAVADEGDAIQKRQEELANAEIPRLLSRQDQASIDKLDAIGILSQSNFDLTDNPYAVALVEKGRGRLVAANLKDKWTNEILPTMAPFKTSQEAVAAYEDYIRENRASLGGTTNVTAFNQGYFENHPIDVLEQATRQRQAKAEEDKQIRDADLMSWAEKMGDSALKNDHDTMTRTVQALLDQATTTHCDFTTKGKLINALMQSIATRSGDSALLDKLTGLKAGVGLSGKEYTVESFGLPMDTYKKMAAARDRQMFGQKYTDFLAKTDKMSIPEFNEEMLRIQRDEPAFFESISSMQEPIVHSKISEQKQKEKKKAELELRRQLYKMNQDSALDSGRAQIKAFLEGRSKDALGNPTDTFEYQHYDKDGVPDGMKSMTTEQKNILFDRTLDEIRYEGLPPQEQLDKMLRVMSMKGFKDQANAYVSTFLKTFSDLNEGNLPQDANGDRLPSGIQEAIDLYHTNPIAFKAIVSDSEILAELGAIDSLLRSEGTLKGAVGLYRQATSTLSEPYKKAFITDQAKELLGGASKITVPSIGGGETTISLINDRGLQGDIVNHLTYLLAAGMPQKIALQTAQQSFISHNVAYRGQLIPDDLFRLAEHPDYGRKVLDSLVNDFAELTGTAPSDVVVKYNYAQRYLTVWGGGSTASSYTVEQLSAKADKLYSESQPNVEGDYNARKDAQENTWTEEEIENFGYTKDPYSGEVYKFD